MENFAKEKDLNRNTFLQEPISLFGASGFVGSHFFEKSEREVLAIPKMCKVGKTKDIIYLIGTVHNYNIFDNPQLDIDVNLKLMIEVLEETRKVFQHFTFNFISTWFVYGEGAIPYQETQACNPKGFYSITKYAAELLLQSYCRTFDINYRIIRLGNVVGAGDRKASKKKNALQYLVDKIRNNEDIELYEGGSILRDYIHINDVVRGIDLIINESPKDAIYNLGSGKGTKIIDLLAEFRDLIGSNSRFITVPTPKFHRNVQVKDAVLDMSKMFRLGYELRYPINAAVLKEL